MKNRLRRVQRVHDKLINQFVRKGAAAPTDEVRLLTEIRDELRTRR